MLLLEGRVEPFPRAYFRPKCHNPAVIIEECIGEYTRAFSAPGALRSGLGYCRAMFDQNRALDAEGEGRKIAERLLSVWGNSGGMGGNRQP